MILAKLNVNKVDKTKLFEGKNGKYLDIVLIETPNDQYGNDYVIRQGVSKEDRERGVKGEILGNAKIIGKGSAPRPKQSAPRDDDGMPPF